MQLLHFTEGNVPAGVATGPAVWSVDQVKQYQDWFDNLMSGNLGERTKVIGVHPTPSTRRSKDEFDEWLARVVCFAVLIVAGTFRAADEQGQRPAERTLADLGHVLWRLG